MFDKKAINVMKKISKKAVETDDTPESQKAWDDGAKDVLKLLK